jgi:hypothetical protein
LIELFFIGEEIKKDSGWSSWCVLLWALGDRRW